MSGRGVDEGTAPDLAALIAENDRLRAEIAELRLRLDEPEQIIRAIRYGEVDAFVVTDRHGEQIYSLRSADLLYRRMIEDMSDGAVALETSGLIVYCNRCFANLVGGDPAALFGTSILSCFHGESRLVFQSLLRDEGSTSGVRSGLTLEGADGRTVPVRVALTPISVDGSPVLCLIVTDRTAELHRDELVVESRRKDEFLAMLAHELRNPIAPIRNAARLLQRDGQEPRRVQWARDVIDRQATQLGRLVDDLLDVSRITRGKIKLEREPVDLAAVLARGIETARPFIEARLQELTIQTPLRALHVDADAVRLSQVVSNLLHNAAKFTPERGQIWLSLEQVDEQARIVVRDQGVGIPADMLVRIFDLFTQVDASLERAQGGLGIGLTLARNLVEMHGGRIEARSDGPGTGSTFTVWLPLLPAEAVPREAAPKVLSAGAVPAESLRILVVDDNVDAAETLVAMLQDLGQEVRMVTEGRQAIDVAQAFRPHLVLLDLGLPDLSGYEVARELRRRPDLSGIRLVALTGYGRDEDRKHSRDMGFDHHWVKPLDPRLLQELLAQLAGDGARRPD